MLGVGLDWAEAFHVAALGRPQSGVTELRRVEHTPAGLRGLIQRIRTLEPDPAQVRVVLETRHGLLVDALLAAGLAWIAAVAVNTLPPWRHQLTDPWLALPLVGLALAVAGPALDLTVAATGRLGRRLGRVVDRATLPPTAAAVAALAAVVADLTLLGIITGHALTSPGSYMWASVILAASASPTRVLLAGRAACRCLVTRAALA